METLTIKIRNQKALRLIQDMEFLDLIQIMPAAPKPGKKLSDIMAGSISREEGQAYHQDVQNSKDEWERDTY